MAGKDKKDDSDHSVSPTFHSEDAGATNEIDDEEPQFHSDAKEESDEEGAWFRPEEVDTDEEESVTFDTGVFSKERLKKISQLIPEQKTGTLGDSVRKMLLNTDTSVINALAKHYRGVGNQLGRAMLLTFLAAVANPETLTDRKKEFDGITISVTDIVVHGGFDNYKKLLKVKEQLGKWFEDFDSIKNLFRRDDPYVFFLLLLNQQITVNQNNRPEYERLMDVSNRCRQSFYSLITETVGLDKKVIDKIYQDKTELMENVNFSSTDKPGKYTAKQSSPRSEGSRWGLSKKGNSPTLGEEGVELPVTRRKSNPK